MPPLVHKFFFSRPHPARGPCVPSSSRPLQCHLSCVFPFFPSLPFVGVVPGISNFWGYKVRSSEDSSACAASPRVPADPVRHSTGNRMSAFRVKPRLPPYEFGSVLVFLRIDGHSACNFSPFWLREGARLVKGISLFAFARLFFLRHPVPPYILLMS